MAQGSEGESPVQVDAQAEPYPSNFYAWYSLILLFGIYLNSFLDRQILGLLVGPIRATLDLTDAQIGLYSVAFAIFYTIAGLPLGWLADRMARKWLILWGQTVWSIASIAFGVSRTFGQSMLARIGVGAGEATLSPSAYSLVADLFPPQKLATALSVYGMGIPIGGSRVPSKPARK